MADRSHPTLTREDSRTQIAAALGLPPIWQPDTATGETETRAILWSVHELNEVFIRNGAATAAPVTRTTSCGTAYTVIEITLTLDIPGVGEIQAVTDWDPETEADALHLPLLQSVATGAQR